MLPFCFVRYVCVMHFLWKLVYGWPTRIMKWLFVSCPSLYNVMIVQQYHLLGCKVRLYNYNGNNNTTKTTTSLQLGTFYFEWLIGATGGTGGKVHCDTVHCARMRRSLTISILLSVTGLLHGHLCCPYYRDLVWYGITSMMDSNNTTNNTKQNQLLKFAFFYIWVLFYQLELAQMPANLL